jgi:predicted ABC-type ATPase
MARVNPRSITAVLNLFSSDLSVARVKERILEGGHDVPEDKVRARYDRGQPLIREAVLRADQGMVYDNSKLNHPPNRSSSLPADA